MGKYGKSCADRQIERCFDYNKLHNPYTEDANCDYLIYYGRMSKIHLNKGKRGDEYTCQECGKVFRVRGRTTNPKYCSDDCREKAKLRKIKHKQSLGTIRHSFKPEAVHKEVERIRKNIDYNKGFNYETKGRHEILLENKEYY